ncbi:SusD/RagB family nutrient-binding outer membrane lipoprotein [Carboxylicivirga mesophila]|uniref:SusD/RagB family nutrient-binding outer membrane lipoprotein n=1 Tax=Carboxylicivirga mesophila TaxID=1166478 RepID=A0ABS5KBP9_9BACT|nr:RagB/SusD family nutrient uptake outer membrane protein [Carboxylicivirga mesophila]MBS2212410.1 SusD/RagB family nutrient-binding outer membrane lipoprotein [Carboxylicivirga mesophila]
MKQYIKKLLVLPLAAIFFLGACTDNFEEMNTNSVGISDEDLKADYQFIGVHFPQIQQMIYCNYNWGWGVNWPFQIMQNLNADIYSGYMMTPTPFAGNVNNTTYALVDGWNASAFDYTYAYMMPAVLAVKNKAEVEFPSFYAVSRILKVLGLSRVSTQYGPIIYSQYGESKTGGEYDKESDLYNNFFTDLEEAVAALEKYVEDNPDAQPFAKFDNFFGGDYNKWIKFANSLQLRLAMRIVKVAPELAQQKAEEAIKRGVFTEGDIAQIVANGYTHPVAAISGSWGDISMSAEMESMLSGYQDPRIAAYFNAPADEAVIAAGYEYKGIRQGIAIDDKATYGGHSLLNLAPESPAVLMTAAEVYFLRAEGALRGWEVGGSAEALYEAGVAASFAQHGVGGLEGYLSSEALPAAYVDVKNDANSVAADSEYMNKVSPMWDAADNNEVKLQKIITQKWIAMFPEGIEAWAEYRRTGYPVLFPVVKNDSQGVIDSDNGIKRLNFSVSEKNNNPDGYAKAVQYLGGPDNGATNLWWDVDGPNF